MIANMFYFISNVKYYLRYKRILFIFFCLIATIFLITIKSHLNYSSQISPCTYLNINKHVKVHENEGNIQIKRISFKIRHIKKEMEIYLGAINRPLSKCLQIFVVSSVYDRVKKMYFVITRLRYKRRPNKFTSFIYASYFDRNFTQILTNDTFQLVKTPGIIPIPVHDRLRDETGPEDPRIFTLPNNDHIILFNMADKHKLRLMHLFNLKTLKMEKLWLHDYWKDKTSKQKSSMKYIEKNWVPIVLKERVYFIYNFKKLQIAECNKSNCSLVVGKLDNQLGYLKGGSGFYRFNNSNFYFSFGYSHMPKHVYRPNLVVIHATDNDPSSIRIVYVSEHLEFEKILYKALKDKDKSDRSCKQDLVNIFSISWIDYEKDVAELTVNVCEYYAFSVRISGLVKFLNFITVIHSFEPLRSNIRCSEIYADNYIRSYTKLF